MQSRTPLAYASLGEVQSKAETWDRGGKTHNLSAVLQLRVKKKPRSRDGAEAASSIMLLARLVAFEVTGGILKSSAWLVAVKMAGRILIALTANRASLILGQDFGRLRLQSPQSCRNFTRGGPLPFRICGYAESQTDQRDTNQSKSFHHRFPY